MVADTTPLPLLRRAEHPGFWISFGVAVLIVAIAPIFFPNSFWQRLLTEVLILGLLAMSSDLLIGYVGMVSFGHALFFGTGCYMAAYAMLWTESGIALWLALLFGLVGASVMGAFVAYFSTRLRDIYFSITTLVFAQIFWVIVFTWTDVTGGENGLVFSPPRLSLLGLFPADFTPLSMHWFTLAVVALCYLTLRRITQSSFGMVLQAIRENEERARAIGYKIEYHKMMAVMLSALCAGLAGALYGIFNAYAAPDYFFFFQSGCNRLRRVGNIRCRDIRSHLKAKLGLNANQGEIAGLEPRRTRVGDGRDEASVDRGIDVEHVLGHGIGTGNLVPDPGAAVVGDQPIDEHILAGVGGSHIRQLQAVRDAVFGALGQS